MSEPAGVVRSWTARLLAEAIAHLREAGVDSAQVDAELLLSHVTGVPRGMLRSSAHPHELQRREFVELVRARCRRVPLQHLTGTAGFRFLDLDVGPGVFVPRPETEQVAGWAIEEVQRLRSEGVDAPVVVDLCTGSGAIALSVVQEAPVARVHAVELDERAFGWAQHNLIGSGVDLRQGDMADAFGDLDGTVDVVVSNPPYIPLDAWESVAPEARDHDPELALWSGDDGLDAMRVLEEVAWRLLRPGGAVGAEHADAQGRSAPAIFSSRWHDVRDHVDLAGRPRWVSARKPPARSL